MARDVLDIKIRGDTELIAALTALPGKVQRRVMRKAVRAALRPVVKTARQLAPQRKREGKSGRFTKSGLLKASIGQRNPKLFPSGVIWGAVGPRSGFKEIGPQGRFENPTKYAHIQEFGSERVPAQPFMRPALDRNIVSVIGILKRTTLKGIDKEVAKLGRGKVKR